MFKIPLLKKHHNFKRLYYAGLTSELGSFVSETAITLYVFMLAGENTAILGISRAVFLFFLTIGALAGGPLGERYNRKTILIYSSYLRIPLMLVLFLFQDLYVIIITSGLIAFFTGIYNPSRQALINELIPPEEIKTANSLFGSTVAILHMAGPFLGAMVYAYTKGINEILLFDLITYFLGIYLLRKITYKKNREPESLVEQKKIDHKIFSKKELFKDMIDGFTFINSRPDLRAILKNTLFNGICIGILIPLLLPFVKDILHRDETSYGLLLATFGLGGMFGGILAKVLSKQFKDGPIIIAAISLEPFVMVLWLNCHNLYLNSFIFFLWGIIVFTRITAQLNHVSETVETKYLTRVHSLLDLAFIAPNISSGIIVAIIGNYYQTMEILNATSVIYVLTIFYCVFGNDSKHLFKIKTPKVERVIYE